jgi:hypothetical protein
MLSSNNGSTLKNVLVQVIDRRFMFYKYDAVPVELEPELWAVEVWRCGSLPPAAGTLAELADVLEKYLYSAGLQISEAVRITADGFAVFIGARTQTT